MSIVTTPKPDCACGEKADVVGGTQPPMCAKCWLDRRIADEKK